MPLYRILVGQWYIDNPNSSGKIMKGPGDIIELNKPISDINKDKLQLVSSDKSTRNVKTESSPTGSDTGTNGISDKQPLKTGAANPGPAPVKP